MKVQSYEVPWDTETLFITNYYEAHTCATAGSRYGDHKCIHDRTHRVCAKVEPHSNQL